MQARLLDTGDFKTLNKQFRRVADGKELRKELASGLRGVLRPYVPRVRAAYLASPSKGHAFSSRARRAQPPLRALLAKATRVEVRLTGRQAGARLRVDGRRMPTGMRSLPAYWEGTKPRWRHPVFGDRDTWVDQRARPTFEKVVRPSEAEARREVERVVGRTLDKIARQP
jgi:hypothetical protein